MRRIVVVGAGGHAKVVVELARACGFIVHGCTDPSTASSEIVGAPVLGTDEVLGSVFAAGVTAGAVAIGDNRLRERAFYALRSLGFTCPPIVSPTAAMSPSSFLGEGTVVMPGAVVNAEVVIGCHAIVNTRASVDHECVIENGAHLAPGVTLAGGVRIGKGALVGVGAAILPGRQVGDHAVVGAGAVVTHDVAAQTRVAGVPARILPRAAS